MRVPDQFGFIGYCHCSECRKWSGTALGAGGMVDSEDFQVIAGEECIAYYRKSEETEMGFCRNCGSSLFSKKLKLGKNVVRLGILDDTPTQRPNVHIFAASQAPWFDMTDELEKHDTVP